MKLFESASKIVFILITISVIVGMFMGIIEAKDYMLLATMVFTYYFTNKGNKSNEYLGK